MRGYYKNIFTSALIKNVYTGCMDDLKQLSHELALKEFEDKSNALRHDIPMIGIGFIFIFTGIISFSIFAARWQFRDYPFFSFGFCLICAGIGFLLWDSTYELFRISPVGGGISILYRHIFCRSA